MSHPGPPGLRIRTAGAADTADVLALWSASRSPAAVTPDTADGVRSLLRTDPGALLIAESGGEAVGALIAAWDGWRGSMYRLSVGPAHRRQGIGRALVEAGEARLREIGAPKVTLMLGREDELARDFWEALGYPRDDEVDRHVKRLP